MTQQAGAQQDEQVYKWSRGFHVLPAACYVVAVVLLWTTALAVDWQENSGEIVAVFIVMSLLPVALYLLPRALGSRTLKLDAKGISRASVFLAWSDICEVRRAAFGDPSVWLIKPLEKQRFWTLRPGGGSMCLPRFEWVYRDVLPRVLEHVPRAKVSPRVLRDVERPERAGRTRRAASLILLSLNVIATCWVLIGLPVPALWGNPRRFGIFVAWYATLLVLFWGNLKVSYLGWGFRDLREDLAAAATLCSAMLLFALWLSWMTTLVPNRHGLFLVVTQSGAVLLLSLMGLAALLRPRRRRDSRVA